MRAGDIAAIVLNGAHACVALVDRRGLSPTETKSEGFEGHYVVVEAANVERRRLRSSIPRATLERRGAKS